MDLSSTDPQAGTRSNSTMNNNACGRVEQMQVDGEHNNNRRASNEAGGGGSSNNGTRRGHSIIPTISQLELPTPEAFGNTLQKFTSVMQNQLNQTSNPLTTMDDIINCNDIEKLREKCKNLFSTKEFLQFKQEISEYQKNLDHSKCMKEQNESHNRAITAQKEGILAHMLTMFEDEMSCSICQEIFIDPFVIECGHTFCKFCIQEWRKEKRMCPVCRQYSGMMSGAKHIEIENLVNKLYALLPQDIREKRNQVVRDRAVQVRTAGNPFLPRRSRGDPLAAHLTSLRDIRVRMGQIFDNQNQNGAELLDESARVPQSDSPIIISTSSRASPSTSSIDSVEVNNNGEQQLPPVERVENTSITWRLLSSTRPQPDQSISPAHRSETSSHSRPGSTSVDRAPTRDESSPYEIYVEDVNQIPETLNGGNDSDNEDPDSEVTELGRLRPAATVSVTSNANTSEEPRTRSESSSIRLFHPQINIIRTLDIASESPERDIPSENSVRAAVDGNEGGGTPATREGPPRHIYRRRTERNEAEQNVLPVNLSSSDEIATRTPGGGEDVEGGEQNQSSATVTAPPEQGVNVSSRTGSDRRPRAARTGRRMHRRTPNSNRSRSRSINNINSSASDTASPSVTRCRRTSSNIASPAETRAHRPSESIADASSESIANASSENVTNASSESIANASSESIANASNESIANASRESIANASSESIANASSQSIANASSESIANASSQTSSETHSSETSNNNNTSSQSGQILESSANANMNHTNLPGVMSGAPDILSSVMSSVRTAIGPRIVGNRGAQLCLSLLDHIVDHVRSNPSETSEIPDWVPPIEGMETNPPTFTIPTEPIAGSSGIPGGCPDCFPVSGPCATLSPDYNHSISGQGEISSLENRTQMGSGLHFRNDNGIPEMEPIMHGLPFNSVPFGGVWPGPETRTSAPHMFSPFLSTGINDNAMIVERGGVQVEATPMMETTYWPRDTMQHYFPDEQQLSDN